MNKPVIKEVRVKQQAACTCGKQAVTECEYCARPLCGCCASTHNCYWQKDRR